MPLIKGTNKKTMGKNISEFVKGKTFRKTSKKFGRKRALKQAVAVAYSSRRNSGFRDNASK